MILNLRNVTIKGLTITQQFFTEIVKILIPNTFVLLSRIQLKIYVNVNRYERPSVQFVLKFYNYISFE